MWIKKEGKANYKGFSLLLLFLSILASVGYALSITWTAPSPGAYIGNSTPVITLSVNVIGGPFDNASNVTFYYFGNGGSNLIGKNNSFNVSIYSYSWVLSALNGTYLLNANIYNRSNGIYVLNNNTNISVVIDTLSPVVSFVSPVDKFNTSNTTVMLSFNATDYNLSYCYIYTSNGGWGPKQTDFSIYSNYYSNFSNDSFTSGTYFWNVVCNDSAGNSAWAGANRNFTVDTTAPTISGFVTNLSYITAAKPFTLTITENGSGNYSNSYSPSCGTGGTFTSGTAIYPFNVSGCIGINQTVTLIVNATDYAMNTGTYVYSYLLDDVAPIVSYVSPINYINTSNTTVSLSFNATDYNLSSCQIWTNLGGWSAKQIISSINTNSYSSSNTTTYSPGIYLWNVWCNDTTGNSAWAGANRTFTVATTPYISNISNVLTNQSSLITWATNENSNSSINFGTTLDLATGYNSTQIMTVSHNITLNNLINNTLYYYNVTSCDASNNCNTTGPYNFTTLTTISNPVAANLNDSLHDYWNLDNFNLVDNMNNENFTNVGLSSNVYTLGFYPDNTLVYLMNNNRAGERGYQTPNGIDMPPEVTLCFWVNNIALDTLSYLSWYAPYNYHINADGFAALKFANGSVQFGCYANAIWQPIPVTTTLTTNRWYQFCYTKNTNYQALYVDGSLNAQSTPSCDTGNLSDSVYYNTYLMMGDYGNSPRQAYDEVALWYRMLNSTEISQVYNSGDGIFYPTWKADETIPSISNVFNISTNQSTLITWTTNKNANSSVKYGTDINLIIGTNSSVSFTTAHSLTLNNLQNNTLYYYNITSCDSSINCNQTGPYNFTTLTTSGLDDGLHNYWNLDNFNLVDSMNNENLIDVGLSSNVYTLGFYPANTLVYLMNSDGTGERGYQTPTGLDLPPIVTLCTWINFADLHFTSYLFYYVPYNFSINPDGFAALKFANGSVQIGCYTNATWEPIQTTTTLTTNYWYQFCYTKNTTYQALYVDGSLNSQRYTTCDTGNIADSVYYHSSLTIGDPGNSPRQAYDEVALWYRMLSSTEISQVYNNGNGIFYPTWKADETIPDISTVSNISTNQSALITWTTNKNANSSVKYGTNINLIIGTNSSNSSTTSHSLTLNNLQNNTLYYYNITSCDSSINCNQTGPYNFTTLTTSGLDDGLHDYWNLDNFNLVDSMNNENLIDVGLSSNVYISGFYPANTHVYLINSDRAGQRSLQTPDDLDLPPIVTLCVWINFADLNFNSYLFYYVPYNFSINPDGFAALKFANGSVQIGCYTNATWEPIQTTTTLTTNYWYQFCYTKNTTYQALYVDGSLNSQSNVTCDTGNLAGSVYYHTSLTIGDSGNSPRQAYDEVALWYRMLSSTEISQVYNNGNGIFYPTWKADETIPDISTVSNISTNQSALITWATNKNTNSSITYGTTIDMTDGPNSDSAFTTSHSITLEYLNNNTFYYYNVTSCDASNNCNTTGPYNFTTLTTVSIPVATGLDDGLQDYWNLDNFNLVDSMNNANFTYLASNVSTNTTGFYPANTLVYLVNRDNAGETGYQTPNGIDMPPEITLCFWVNNIALDALSYLSWYAPYNYHINPDSFAAIKFANGSVQFGCYANAIWQPIPITTTLTTNRWYQLCYVKNTNYQALYVDGSLNAESTPSCDTGNLSDSVYYNTYLRMGDPGNSPRQAYDEVALWYRMLNSTEISSVYNNGKGSFYPTWKSCEDNACNNFSQDLLAVWHLDNLSLDNAVGNGLGLTNVNITGSMPAFYPLNTTTFYITQDGAQYQLVNYTGYDLPDGQTFCLWVNYTNASYPVGYWFQINGGPDAIDGIDALITNNRFRTGPGGLSNFNTILPALNAWEFHCFVRNSTYFGYYRNGILLNSTTGSFETGAFNNFFEFGDSGNNNSEAFDEMVLWTRILTPDEISTLYNNGKGIFYPTFVTIPYINLIAPVNESNISSSTLSFNFTATNNLVANLTCYLTLDGGIYISYINTSNSYNSSLTVSGLRAGTHTWNVTCWDQLYNTNTSETRVFTKVGCSENWNTSYGPCLKNDSKLKFYQDLNSCGTHSNIPSDNGTYVSCKYCNVNWTCSSFNNSGDCLAVLDVNYCYDVTHLSSENYTGDYSEFKNNNSQTPVHTATDAINGSDAHGTVTNSTMNSTTISSMQIFIGNHNLSEWGTITGTLQVNFEKGDSKIAEFSYNFTNGTLNMNKISIEQGFNESGAVKGYVMVRGIDTEYLFNATKTLYINNLDNNLNWVCIKDAPISSISEITSNCKGADEYHIQCNGIEKDGYTCINDDENPEQYKITGLHHSGIIQTGATEVTTPLSNQAAPSSSEGGGVGGLSTVILPQNSRGKTWYSILANSDVSWDISNFTITEIKIQAGKQSSNAQMLVSLLNNTPLLIEAENAYQYLNISAQNIYVTTATIQFRVNISWARNNEVVLSRFTTAWTDLPTIYVKKDTDYAYYTAISPGFSYFAIRSKSNQEQPLLQEENRTKQVLPVENTTKETPTEPNTVMNTPPPEQKVNLVPYVIFFALIMGILILSIRSYQKYVKKMKEKIAIKKEDDELRKELKEKEEISKIFREKKNTIQLHPKRQRIEYSNENQVIEYLDRMRNKGKSDLKIIEDLIKAGWNKETLQKIYEKSQK